MQGSAWQEIELSACDEGLYRSVELHSGNKQVWKDRDGIETCTFTDGFSLSQPSLLLQLSMQS